MINNKWLYKIRVRISKDVSWDGVNNMCSDIKSEIYRVLKKCKIEEDYIIYQLEDVINDCEIRLLDEKDDLMSVEDSVDECNYMLENLYDICDCKVTINGVKNKFIWIEKI